VVIEALEPRAVYLERSQEPARLVACLEYSHLVSALKQPVRRNQACNPRADYCD
jgi:hypothetical protein